MTFLFQSLLAIGLPLIGVPLLIHLINLRRRRRVDWAAMEFLLASQKRSKRSILLLQLLLLLVRTAVVAAVVLMLAGPTLRSSWGKLLGRGTTHHVILLDDSYSMADHNGQMDQTGTQSVPTESAGQGSPNPRYPARNANTVYGEARRVVGRIVEQAAHGSSRGELTLIRFSQAASLTAGTEPEISRRPIDSALSESLAKTLQDVSETDAGPLEALQAAARLPESTDDEARIVYLLSDFRRPQWAEGSQLRQEIGALRRHVSQLRLVHCAEQTRANLAITELTPVAGIRAAGVETWFRLTVHNYGSGVPGSDEVATGVTVTIRQDGHDLPAVTLDEIPAGEEVSRQFRVTFMGAGAHGLVATLPTDALEPDNQRYFACHLPETFPVLILDGSAAGDDSYYLQTALSPGGMQSGGWSPEMHPASYLRRHEELSRFAAICLLDVARLDEDEIAALENYVRRGGGVALFLGPQVNKRFYNEHLYRNGAGLLPVALDVPTQLLSERENTNADVRVTDHPLFRMFAGRRNSFLSVATVDYYYAVAPQWVPPADGETRVLARLSNGAPWIVDKQLGAGRVLVHLSKLSPKKSPQGSWSNWSLNPVFPVFANELMGYLSAARRHGAVRTVGEGLGLAVSAADYQSEIRLRRLGYQGERNLNAPARSGAGLAGGMEGTVLYLSPARHNPAAPLPATEGSLPSTPSQPATAPNRLAPRATDPNLLERQSTPLAGQPLEPVPLTLNTEVPIDSGIWQVDLLHRDGKPEKRFIAVNVPTGEGELHTLDRTAIAKYLKGIDYHFSRATDISSTNQQMAGYRLGDALLGALVFLLFVEQLLSYRASYHHRSAPQPRSTRSSA